MHLKILQFLQWFGNVMGCREAVLHLFVKQIPPTDSWHQVHPDMCNFLPLMAALTLFFSAGKTSGVGNCHAA
jgi:FlaA1/EpsC-like NDP-sugar epimerase